MKKFEAVKTIAHTLVQKGYLNLIEDDVVKTHLLKNNYGHILINSSKPDNSNLDELIFEAYKKGDKYDAPQEFKSFHKEHQKHIKDEILKIQKANYIFTKTDTVISASNDRFILGVKTFCTPFAIITDNELEILTDIYNGFLPEPIKEALQALDINSEKISPDYQSLAEKEPKLFITLYKSLNKQNQVDVIKTIMDSDSQIHPELKDYLNSDGNRAIMREATFQ